MRPGEMLDGRIGDAPHTPRRASRRPVRAPKSFSATAKRPEKFAQFRAIRHFGRTFRRLVATLATGPESPLRDDLGAATRVAGNVAAQFFARRKRLFQVVFFRPWKLRRRRDAHRRRRRAQSGAAAAGRGGEFFSQSS